MKKFTKKYQWLINNAKVYYNNPNKVEEWFAELGDFINGNEYYELEPYRRSSFSRHSSYLTKIRNKLSTEKDNETDYGGKLLGLGEFFHHKIEGRAKVKLLLSNLKREQKRIIDGEPSFLQRELKKQGELDILSYLEEIKEMKAQIQAVEVKLNNIDWNKITRK